MAQISDGTDTLLITPSGAAYATLYDPSGNALHPVPVGAYALPVNIRFTAAIAAASTVWTVRNGTTYPMYITRIYLEVGFDGTPAASTQYYELRRFTTATPSGETALTAIKKKSSYGASTIADARETDSVSSAALTVTSVVFETAFAVLANPRQNGATNILRLEFVPWSGNPFVLAVNEGLCIQIINASVIGDSIAGTVEWYEV